MTEDTIKNDIYLEKELLAPFTYLTQVKGKQLRVKIALAFNHWLQVPKETLLSIVSTIELLHNASLLADDIQDNCNVRRGIPSAHCVFGVPLTLNASLHVTFLVLQKTLRFGPQAVKIFSEEIIQLSRGQAIEIYWRDNYICPSEEEYKTMLELKTGHMFVLGARLLQLFSDHKAVELTRMALLLGLYFQIRDDYCNLCRQKELEEWPASKYQQARRDVSFCEDLTEGKFSMPIIHAMKTPEWNEILNILRQRTEDVTLKRYCMSLLEKAGSLQYTREVLEDLDRTARAEVASLGGNPDMEDVLDELMSWKHESLNGINE